MKNPNRRSNYAREWRESASIHHDKYMPPCFYITYLAFKAEACSQSTGNIKKKTTAFLDSAVPTKSFQDRNGLIFRNMPPHMWTAQAAKHTSWVRGCMICIGWNQLPVCLWDGAAELSFQDQIVILSQTTIRNSRRGGLPSKQTLLISGNPIIKHIICSQETQGACSSLLVFSLDHCFAFFFFAFSLLLPCSSVATGQSSPSLPPPTFSPTSFFSFFTSSLLGADTGQCSITESQNH